VAHAFRDTVFFSLEFSVASVEIVSEVSALFN